MSNKLNTNMLVLATHNAGKVAEMQKILAPYDIKVLSADDLKLSEPEETGTTFVENALIKAISASKEANMVAIADDSGLCVHALNNRPGIYSARYNEPKKNGFDYAMKCLDEELKEKTDNKDRSAHFSCAIAVAFPNGETKTFEGIVNGSLCWPARGNAGFGYDPMFVPDGYDKSFAELSGDVKNKISHRANALKQFIDYFLK
ncbi:MAG: RdgB/HAM1 family non-canonical purine NTP pyrophosphatase [Alphaproteobacteria bacterium]|nr:RdgB/HAM1 family non-canonical purine NTP pyrophosphatase [Alphaproteobacteria bacterium]